MSASLGLLTLLLTCWVSSVPAGGPESLREFDSPQQRQQYWSLLEKLRCLVCQNESLATSQADLAEDLRDEVYIKLVKEGHANSEIVDYLVERYGDFVLYRPPWEPSTYLLWAGPFLLLGIGAGVAAVVIRRRSQTQESTAAPDPAERARASALLEGETREETKQ